MTISFTSTSAGCSMANAIARATAAGGIAIFSIRSAIWALTPGFVMESARLVWTNPGEIPGHAQLITGFLPQGLSDCAHRVLGAGIDRHGRYDLNSCCRNNVDEMSETLLAENGQ